MSTQASACWRGRSQMVQVEEKKRKWLLVEGRQSREQKELVKLWVYVEERRRGVSLVREFCDGEEEVKALFGLHLTTRMGMSARANDLKRR
ncbi:hypothetical protein M5K25_018762 [Dendrobium thyrsiflorum]|uniref:Uncharacterized protein n=1 Tax=Dendrobium thyrsiflorum TaxID=117978 RepID=A0ABD0UD05_DENTH